MDIEGSHSVRGSRPTQMEIVAVEPGMTLVEGGLPCPPPYTENLIIHDGPSVRNHTNVAICFASALVAGVWTGVAIAFHRRRARRRGRRTYQKRERSTRYVLL